MATYYPLLTDLFEVDPEVVPFIDSCDLDDLLPGVFYKNLQSSVSPDNSSHYYAFEIIVGKSLNLSPFGLNDFELSLNGSDPLMVGFEYEIKILKYINSFSTFTKFGGELADLYSTIQKIFQLNSADLLARIIELFVFEDETNDSVGVFIENFNSKNSPGIDIVNNNISDYSENLKDIVDQIESQDLDLVSILFDDYIQEFKDLEQIVKKFSGSSLDQLLKDWLLPKFRLTIDNLGVSLEFPEKYLKPIDENNEVIPNEKSKLTFNAGNLEVSSDGGISFENLSSFDFQRSLIGDSGFILEVNDLRIDLSRTKNIPEADADGRPVDFIGCYIYESTIGLPKSWSENSGTDSTAEIKARNLLIGTGGISGTISLEAIDPDNEDPALIQKKLGDFEVKLDDVSVTFHQNSIVDSRIHGSIKIPGFKREVPVPENEEPPEEPEYEDVWIDIEAFIGTGGDFGITASIDEGYEILLPDVLKITILSLGYFKRSEKHGFKVSGLLDILATMDGVQLEGLPKKIPVPDLIIWDDGKIEIPKDVIKLPKAVKLKVGPVTLSVSDIGFGSYQQKHKESGGEEYLRQYKFFGFSGSLNTGPGGVSVSGDGVKFYYTVDNNNDENVGPIKTPHRFLRIQGIGIDIKIPGTAKKPEDAQLLLKGYLAMRNAPAPNNTANANPNPQREYLGNVDFALNKIKLYGSAAMRINPDVPAFLVDVNVDLPQGIPLGTTGLAIKGFRGLVGQKYLPDKAETKEWWQYYKDPALGIGFKKFKQDDGFSLGAGVAFETQPDKGKAVSGKVFFLLGLPDVFLLQGQAGFLEGSQKLNDPADPPFQALIAIDKHSIKSTLGVKYYIPNEQPQDGEDDTSGKVATIDGKAEMAFFFNNASGWYVNIGKDLPESERIKARILDLFDAYAFTMITKRGIQLGAGAKFEFERNFAKIVKIVAGAYVDVRGKISFKPSQIGGSITLGGYAYASVLKFKLGIALQSYLSAEVNQPYMVTGKMGVTLELPKPMKGKSFEIEFTWIRSLSKNQDPFQILSAPVPEALPAKASNMLTGENFALNYSISEFTESDEIPEIPAPTDSAWHGAFADFTVPLDSFIDVTFDRSVESSGEYDGETGSVAVYGNIEGTEHIEMIPPQKGILDQVKHELALVNVKINYWNGSAWAPYFPYDSISSLQEVPEVITALGSDATFLKQLPVAYWQAVEQGKKSNLRIMGRNMFPICPSFYQAHTSSNRWDMEKT